MKTVFNSFLLEITDIRNHIEFIDNLKTDIIATSKSSAYSNSSSRKKYDYNAVIISLYGIVENNIEKFVMGYLEAIEKEVFIYNILDKKLIDNHFMLSIQLIKLRIEDRHQKFQHLKKEDILSQLNNCTNNVKGYRFNKEAFIINSGNLKHSRNIEIFKNINVDIDKEIKKFPEFSLKTDTLFNKLDDLVDRRNEVAHGGASDILDNSEITPIIDFIEIYLTKIYESLSIQIENETNRFKKEVFGILIERFKLCSSTILGIIEGVKFDLKIGDEIYIETSNKEILKSKIIDLRTFPNSDSITIKLDTEIKENQKFYAYKAKKTKESSYSIKVYK